MRIQRLLLCVVGLYAMSSAVALAAEPAPALKVTIGIDDKSVEPAGSFSVSTQIQNIGERAITLAIWSCSYSQNWISDNPAVTIESMPCKKNVLEGIALASGRTYTNSLEVRSTTEQPFRLGFMNGQLDVKMPASKPVWSNPLTVSIKPVKKEITFTSPTLKGQILKPGEKAPATTLEKSEKDAATPSVPSN